MDHKQPPAIPNRKKQLDHYNSPTMPDPKTVAQTLPLEGKNGICSDIQGSYTGMDIDGDAPVQDADDL